MHVGSILQKIIIKPPTKLPDCFPSELKVLPFYILDIYIRYKFNINYDA